MNQWHNGIQRKYNFLSHECWYLYAYYQGIDTTAHTATFLLYHLATNPEKQVQLYFVIYLFFSAINFFFKVFFGGRNSSFYLFWIPITFIHTFLWTQETYYGTHFATFRANSSLLASTLTFIQYSFILGVAKTTIVVTCIYRNICWWHL